MKLSSHLNVLHGAGTAILIENLSFPCLILSNGQRIFPVEEVSKTFGYNGNSTNWLADFLDHLSRLTTIDPELLKLVENPVLYEVPSSREPILRHGIASAVFLEWCKAVIKAKNDGFLFRSELPYARKAETFLTACTKVSLDSLIDYSTGYVLYKQNLKNAIYRFMQQKYKADFFVWMKAFPDEFFYLLFKMKKWDWPDLHHNADVIANFINNVCFARLSSMLLEELITTRPRMKYRKQNQPEVYVLHPELQQHLTAVMSLIKAVGEDEDIFNQLLDQVYPMVNKLLFFTGPKATSASGSEKHSAISKSLRKLLNL